MAIISNFSTFAQISFTPADTLLSGYSHPKKSVLVIDCNADQLDDIVYMQNDEVTLILNENGSYTNKQLIYSSNHKLLKYSNIADINSDGLNDFAIATEKSVLLMLQTENSILMQKEIQFEQSFDNVVVYLADFDGDDRTDIIYHDQGKIYVIENQGNFDFAEPIQIIDLEALQLNVLRDFEVLDYDLDNDADVIMLEYGNSMNAIVNNNDNTFTPVVLFSSNNGPTSFQCADLNGDNYVDFVVSSYNFFEVYCTDVSHQYVLTDDFAYESAMNISIGKLLLGDKNNDGNKDIILHANKSEDLVVFQGNGDGTFMEGNRIKTELGYFNDAQIGKFDQDADLDLYLIDDYSQLVQIAPTGNSYTADSSLLVISRPYMGIDRAFTDIDGDGYKDLVQLTSGALCVNYGFENGISHEFHAYPTKINLLSINSPNAVIHDINGDGLADIIFRQTFENESNQFYQLINLGERKFTPAHIFRDISTGNAVDACDYDNDGDEDILTVDENHDSIYVFDAGVADVLEHRNSAVMPKLPLLSANLHFVKFLDINGDDFEDIVVGYGFEEKLGYFVNNRAGGFFAEKYLAPGGRVYETSVADLDNDGSNELLVGHDDGAGSYYLSVYDLDTVTEEFVFRASLETGISDTHFRITDFDKNGFMDIFVFSDNNRKHAFFLNYGDSIVKSELQIEGSFFTRLIFDDYNNDGFEDVISVDVNNHALLFLNNSVIEPKDKTSILSITNSEPNSAEVVLSPSGNSGRLVLLSDQHYDTVDLLDNKLYDANPIYQMGEETQTNVYAIYSGTDEIVIADNLAPHKWYYAYVIDYNLNEPQRDIVNYRIQQIAMDSIYIKDVQELKWDEFRDYNIEEGEAAINIYSSASLDVQVELVNGPVTLFGDVLQFQSVGEVVISATQSGNSEYFSADSTFNFIIFQITDLELLTVDKPLAYPNPFTGSVEISLPADENYTEVRLMDLNGRILRLFNVERIRSGETADFSGLDDGLYILELKGESISCIKLYKESK